MPRSVTLLWVVGVFVCFLDYPVIPVGGSALKVAYLVFPFLFSFVLLHNDLRVNKRQALLGTLFVVGVLPSIVFSTDIKTSLAFLLGVGVCLMIMSSMYVLTRAIGMRTVGMLVWVYRITVIITVPLFVSGLQYRGHFTLYEASYWAIALIPYYCIAFHKLLTVGKRAFVVDGLFILTAIIISQSVSMVIWAVLSFIGLLIAMRMVRIRSVLVATMTSSVLGVIAYKFSARAEGIFDAIWNIADWDSVVSLLLLIGGNRLQRTLVAYQALHDHPLLGVGLGALKNFTDLHFRAGDFSLTGMSAMDFDTSLPATNVLLELAAECGIVGLLAFLLLLHFIFKQCKNKPAVIPFRIALWVTMLSLMLESSYLRPYVWMLYGISLGLSSLHAEIKPKRRFPRIRLFGSTQEIASPEPSVELVGK
jgi:O-antigen ligase